MPQRKAARRPSVTKDRNLIGVKPDDPLMESWDSLTKFNQCQRGRISNMGLEGDIFDEFVQRQSRPTPVSIRRPSAPALPDSDDPEDDPRDPDEDFEIPVLPQGRHPRH